MSGFFQVVHQEETKENFLLTWPSGWKVSVRIWYAVLFGPDSTSNYQDLHGNRGSDRRESNLGRPHTRQLFILSLYHWEDTFSWGGLPSSVQTRETIVSNIQLYGAGLMVQCVGLTIQCCLGPLVLGDPLVREANRAISGCAEKIIRAWDSTFELFPQPEMRKLNSCNQLL